MYGVMYMYICANVETYQSIIPVFSGQLGVGQSVGDSSFLMAVPGSFLVSTYVCGVRTQSPYGFHPQPFVWFSNRLLTFMFASPLACCKCSEI